MVIIIKHISWNCFVDKAVYNYKDTVYNIEVKKASKDFIELDGKKVHSNISLVNDKKDHLITVHISK